MPALRLLSRAWFYFRIGYQTYLTFLLGAASTLTVLYYLLIRNVPQLESIFPQFWFFALIAVACGTPLSVIIGLIHMKRSPLFSSEQDIGAEANPYSYKLPPGYWREVIMPSYLELIRDTRRAHEREGILTPEEKTRYRELEEKMELLIKGGRVGWPP
jgi:hypothetical protein